VKYDHKHLLDEVANVMQIDFKIYLRTVQPYINSTEIRDLINQGFIIGAHSVDHPIFRDLPLEEQLTQALNSLVILNDLYALKYKAFAFPNTDSGVSHEFYDRTHYNGLIDISFGTSDFYKGYCNTNIQRQPMERGKSHAKLIYKRLLGQEILTSFKHKLYSFK
jgi:hypothetical protein